MYGDAPAAVNATSALVRENEVSEGRIEAARLSGISERAVPDLVEPLLRIYVAGAAPPRVGVKDAKK